MKYIFVRSDKCVIRCRITYFMTGLRYTRWQYQCHIRERQRRNWIIYVDINQPIASYACRVGANYSQVKLYRRILGLSCVKDRGDIKSHIVRKVEDISRSELIK